MPDDSHTKIEQARKKDTPTDSVGCEHRKPVPRDQQIIVKGAWAFPRTPLLSFRYR